MGSAQALLLPTRPALTKAQLRGFLAAWGGLALGGMDSFIYALVLVPALRDLLPHSGIPATPGATGYYGGLIFAAFLVGWGLSFVWGPVADHFGRVLTLALTIVCYSLFTFLGAVAKNVWMLAAFRLLAGIGIGGEWTLGSTFIAEALPDRRRAMGAGVLTGGFYLGMFFAALVNHTVGSRFGWRAVFAVGGAPICSDCSEIPCGTRGLQPARRRANRVLGNDAAGRGNHTWMCDGTFARGANRATSSAGDLLWRDASLD